MPGPIDPAIAAADTSAYDRAPEPAPATPVSEPFNREGRDYYVDKSTGKLVSVDAGFDPSTTFPSFVPASEQRVKLGDARNAQGGVAGVAKTVGETAVAAGAEAIHGLGKVANVLDPTELYQPTDRWDIHPENVAPFAFSKEAKQRREINPRAALAGQVAAELPLALLPGGSGKARLAATAGRAVLGGFLAEGGEAAITGKEFDVSDAAFYSTIGGLMEGATEMGIGRLMRATGKAQPTALEGAARKALVADADDAVGELDGVLRAEKMDHAGPAVMEKATDDLTESLQHIETRLDEHAAKIDPKSVAQNMRAQEDELLGHSVKLSDIATNLEQGSPAEQALGKTIRDNIDPLLSGRSSAKLYQQARGSLDAMRDALGNDAPAAAREAIENLGDSLKSEGLWGKAGRELADRETASASRETVKTALADELGAIDRNRVAQVLEPPEPIVTAAEAPKGPVRRLDPTDHTSPRLVDRLDTPETVGKTSPIDLSDWAPEDFTKSSKGAGKISKGASGRTRDLSVGNTSTHSQFQETLIKGIAENPVFQKTGALADLKSAPKFHILEDGTIHIESGRNRLLAARQIGRKDIVARVFEGRGKSAKLIYEGMVPVGPERAAVKAAGEAAGGLGGAEAAGAAEAGAEGVAAAPGVAGAEPVTPEVIAQGLAEPPPNPAVAAAPPVDRTSLLNHLEAAQAAAEKLGDKGLLRAVAKARKALDMGEEAAATKVLGGLFDPQKAAQWAAKKGAERIIKGGLTALGAAKLGPLGAMAADAIGDAVAPKIVEFGSRLFGGGLGGAAETASVDATRATLEALKRSKSYQIASAARALVSKSVRQAATTLPKLAGPTASVGMSRFLGDYDSPRAAFEARRDMLTKLTTDPQSLIQEMSGQLEGLHQTAPDLHRGIIEKTTQVVGFLKSKVPETVGASLSNPAGIPPSKAAIRQFGLYYSAATDPSSVIEDVKNNRVDASQMQTLREVWNAEVYTPLKQQTLEAMTTSKPSVTQRMRMDTLFDFGKSLDTSLDWGIALKADEARKNDPQEQRKPTPPRRRTQVSTKTAKPAGLEGLENSQSVY